MIEKTVKFLEKNIGYILSYILSVCLMSALASCYDMNFFSFYTFVMAALILFFYLSCGLVLKRKNLAKIVIPFLCIAVLMLSYFLILFSDDTQGYRQWFMSGGSGSDSINYLIATTLIFSAAFSYILFYFTAILFRPFFLAVVSAIPCVVYVKVTEDISNIYLSLIAILYVIILSYNSLRNNKIKRKGILPFMIAAVGFSLIVLAAAALIPKQSDAKYYDKFKRFFIERDVNTSLSAGYTNLSEHSGNADFYRDFISRRMYLVYGENVPYLKKQQFDYYDFDNDYWYPDKQRAELKYTLDEWSEKANNYSLAKMQDAIKSACGYDSSFEKNYNLSDLCGNLKIVDPAATMWIVPENFNAQYFLVPSRAIGISQTYNIPEVTVNGTFQPTKGKVSEAYSVNYYDESRSRFNWFQHGGANFSDDEEIAFLEDLNNILESHNDSENLKISKAFLERAEDAQNYEKQCSDNNKQISSQIKNLAESITKGMTYDYEKANALQEYFIRNGYTYDLKYVASDSSPEYFLFTSKRGSCSDYAAAFVLLARSIGLNARYTEGFVPEESDANETDAQYEILDSGAHAYPEVYIQDMGWIVYEPTVATQYMSLDYMRGQGSGDDQNKFTIDFDLTTYILLLAGGVILIILMVVFCLPFFANVFRIERIKIVNPNKSVLYIYHRYINKIKKYENNAESYTPEELGKAVKSRTGIYPFKAISGIEKLVYENKNLSQEDKKNCINEMNAIFKTRKKRWRNRK